MPSTIALVNAPFCHALLSIDDSAPVEEAKATMPPFSDDVTVLISTFTSTGARRAALPAWQVSRNTDHLARQALQRAAHVVLRDAVGARVVLASRRTGRNQ